MKKKPILFVDPLNGPYKKIQEAIDAAEPGCKILVVSGLYRDNIVIT